MLNKETKAVVVHCANGAWISVNPVAEEVFRIRLNRNGYFSESLLERYGIIRLPKSDRPSQYDPAATTPYIVSAGRSTVCLDQADGRFRLEDESGDAIIEAVPACKAPAGADLRITLQADEQFYGLGNTAPEQLERRGLRVPIWSGDTLWSSAPIPYLMSSRGWAILTLAIHNHIFDIGYTTADLFHLEFEQDDLDLLLLTGSSYAELLNRYTAVAGRPILMPIWMYGLNYSSRDDANAREVLDDAMNFRQSGIPCDLLGISGRWTDPPNDPSPQKKWDTERFPISSNKVLHQLSFIGILKNQGFKLSLSISCDYDLTALEEILLAESTNDPTSELITTQTEGWYKHLQKFVNDGASAFVVTTYPPTHKFPDRIWTNGKSSRDLHNIYAVLLGKQMHHGYLEQTGLRPVIHMERGYTGIQQYTVSTTGTYYNAPHAITALLNYGLSGHVNTSTNMHISTREGIHAGFLLTWSRISSLSLFQHPLFLEPSLRRLLQTYARLRYRLLPYLYSIAHIAASTGMPVTRAMPLMYPDDPVCRNLASQFMLGDTFLVAVFTDHVYLPEGQWIDYWTGERWTGPLHLEYNPPEQAGGPLFIRDGAIIPLWPQLDFIHQIKAIETITLQIYPNADNAFTLYEDDGLTMQYTEGRKAMTQIECSVESQQIRIHIAKRAGEYPGMIAHRSYELLIYWDQEPDEIVVDGQQWPQLDTSADIQTTSGWRRDPVMRAIHMLVAEPAQSEHPCRIEIRHAVKSTTKLLQADPDANLQLNQALEAAVQTGEFMIAEKALAAWWSSQSQDTKLETAAQGKPIHPVIQKISWIIDQGLEKELTLHAVAEQLFLHPFYLSRLFKRETGQNFSAYVTEKRMERARKLIEAGLKIYEVATMSGYPDAGNFSKAFKAYWGHSPSYYKTTRPHQE